MIVFIIENKKKLTCNFQQILVHLAASLASLQYIKYVKPVCACNFPIEHLVNFSPIDSRLSKTLSRKLHGFSNNSYALHVLLIKDTYNCQSASISMKLLGSLHRANAISVKSKDS